MTNRRIGCIASQVFEGQIGYKTATAASVSTSKSHRQRTPSKTRQREVLSWDSGGGSFQIANSKGDMYGGAVGSSTCLQIMMELQGRAFQHLSNQQMVVHLQKWHPNHHQMEIHLKRQQALQLHLKRVQIHSVHQNKTRMVIHLEMLPTCSGDTYETTACTSNSNRACSSCTSTCSGDTYETMACTR